MAGWSRDPRRLGWRRITYADGVPVRCTHGTTPNAQNCAPRCHPGNFRQLQWPMPSSSSIYYHTIPAQLHNPQPQPRLH